MIFINILIIYNIYKYYKFYIKKHLVGTLDSDICGVATYYKSNIYIYIYIYIYI